MSEIKTILCPNCGANTTNTQNCEYCGSLLVRFVDRGIDLSKTSYTNNDQVIPGLIEELQRNLKLQKENPNEPVVTDLYAYDRTTETSHAIAVMTPGKTSWGDGIDMGFERKEGFIISLIFSRITQPAGYDSFNQEVENFLKRFKELDCFPLFTSHMSSYTWNGQRRYGPEYAIDFGTDIEGAARLISEIWYKVNGRSIDENVDFLTNVGVDNVNRARDQWDKAHGLANEDDSDDSDWWAYVVGGAIGLFIVWLFF